MKSHLLKDHNGYRKLHGGAKTFTTSGVDVERCSSIPTSAETSQQPEGAPSKPSHPQRPWSVSIHVLHSLSDYMANVTARAEDGAHRLYQLGQLTNVISPTFVLSPCSFLAHTEAFSKSLSDLILSEICGTSPVD